MDINFCGEDCPEAYRKDSVPENKECVKCYKGCDECDENDVCKRCNPSYPYDKIKEKCV